MQIKDLPDVGRDLTGSDVVALDDANGSTKKVSVEQLQPTPLAVSIPTGQWSGSGSDYYISIAASNVTADSILLPHYDQASAALLNGPVWCVPAAGSFTIHTTAIPSGTVTVLVQFVGTLGEAQYQVLSDVYSKAQVDGIVAQAIKPLRIGDTNTSWIANADYNSYTTTGIYFISTNPTNGPNDGHNGDWSLLWVLGGRSDTVVQVQFNKTGVHCRILSTTWQSWKTMA